MERADTTALRALVRHSLADLRISLTMSQLIVDRASAAISAAGWLPPCAHRQRRVLGGVGRTECTSCLAVFEQGLEETAC